MIGRHDYRRFLYLQMSRWRASPKNWIALILIGLIVGGMALDYRRAAEYVDANVQFLEIGIMLLSYRVSFMFYIFGLALMLSDAPFFDDNTIYYISRMGATKWQLCSSAYILTLAAFYAIFIAFLGVLFMAGKVVLTNGWSPVATALAIEHLPIALGQGIYFPQDILARYSPISAFIIQYVLAVLYGYLMGMIIAICNLRLKRSVGFIAAAALHALMLVISLDNLPFFRHFSLYNYACLSNQKDAASTLISALILLTLDLALTFYGIRCIQKTDITTASISWIS